ncbi:MAG: hypothetical protein OXH04_06680 [Acidobacteria bacterium]|nr:hypothetical protein [Acidobacteriota bacterium]
MAILNIKNLPDDLHAKLRERARRERRSVSGQATHLLEQALSEPPHPSILELRGLGKEIWTEVDPAVHVERERDGWD